MASLDEISELAAKQHEECVRECIELDYAFKVGKLAEWVDRKYERMMAAAYGGQPTGGTDPAA